MDVKEIPRRSQIEIRNKLLDNGQKVISYKLAKNLLNCPSVLWKAELTSDEIGCLTEALPKQSVKGPAFLLTAYVSRET